MIPFLGVLGERDRLHLRSILEGSGETRLRDKVGRFLREDTFMAEEAVEAFARLPQGEREKVISELVWRLTCHLDGSVTRVQGVNTFDLGGAVRGVLSEREGREIFCLVGAAGE